MAACVAPKPSQRSQHITDVPVICAMGTTMTPEPVLLSFHNNLGGPCPLLPEGHSVRVLQNLFETWARHTSVINGLYLTTVLLIKTQILWVILWAPGGEITKLLAVAY